MNTRCFFLNLRRATYETHKVYLTTESFCSRKPRMANHDLHIARRTICHGIHSKNRALTPPPSSKLSPYHPRKPSSPLEKVDSYTLGDFQARGLRLEIRTNFGHRKPHLRFPKTTACLFPGSARNKSSRPDKPCARCDMLLQASTPRPSDVCRGLLQTYRR